MASTITRDGYVFLRTEGSTETELSVQRTDSDTDNPLAQIKMFGSGKDDYQGVLAFETINNGSSDGPTEERMRIHTNGNVGIGATKPSEKLEVDGTVKAAAFDGDGSQLTGISESKWSDAPGGDIYYGKGNVGIGTPKPDARLHVNDGDILLGNNHAVMFEDVDGLNHRILRLDQNNDVTLWNPKGGANDDIYFGTGPIGGSNIRMVVKGGGNVGIGTADPKAPLHVANYMAVGPFSATGGQGGIDVTGGAAELGFVKRTLTSWPAKPVAGDRFVWYNPNGTARLWTHGKGDLVTVKSTGEVGIGTTDPKAPLHVANYMAVGPFSATGGQGGIDVTGGAAELGFVKRTLTSWPAKPVAGDRFVWYNPDGTARLWTTKKGDLLTVKNTGEVSIPKGAILNGVAIGVDPPGDVNFHWAYETVGTTDKRWNLRLHSFKSIYFHVNNQTAASKGVAKDGNWTGSTREIKNNICDFTAQEAIEILADLNPIKFSYRADERNKPHVGFIAEEVPDVIASPDKKMISEIDIVAVLTKVVQEQQRTIVDLSKKIELLRACN